MEIRLGQDVSGYWEDEEGKEAGVVLSNGERLRADVVVGADGVKSKARVLVLVRIAISVVRDVGETNYFIL